MRKFLLIFLMCFLGLTSFGKIVRITVSNFQFTPASTTVNVGDSVIWTETSGAHTTTSGSIPGGAASWNYTFPGGVGDSFVYKVTVAGTYNYSCTFHGFTGSFTATVTGNNPNISSGAANISIYPNPFVQIVNIDIQGTNSYNQIEVHDVMGSQVAKISVDRSGHNKLNLGDLSPGIYFITLIGDRTKETYKVLKNN